MFSTLVDCCITGIYCLLIFSLLLQAEPSRLYFAFPLHVVYIFYLPLLFLLAFCCSPFNQYCIVVSAQERFPDFRENIHFKRGYDTQIKDFKLVDRDYRVNLEAAIAVLYGTHDNCEQFERE